MYGDWFQRLNIDGTTPKPGLMADFVTNNIELLGSALIFIFGRIRIIAKGDY
jgi:hypothetical protein